MKIADYNFLIIVIQIWLAIISSLLAVAACSWFIIYISGRFMNLVMPVQLPAAKIMIYFFKVIVQQGKVDYY
jgi:hypothetical protein